jgi:hypothetical protein
MNRQDAKNAKERRRKGTKMREKEGRIAALLRLPFPFSLLSFFSWRSWRLGG